MSRTNKVKKNIIYAFLFQVLKMILLFVSRIIFVKKLGAEYLGINGLFSNVLGVLSLADLGMSTALMYALYKPISVNDETKINQYMKYFKKIYDMIAFIILAVGIMLIPFLKYLVNLPNDINDIYVYYILLLLNSVISYLFVYKTTLVTADQKMYLLNKIDILFQFILFIIQTAILLLTSNFTLYLIGNIICTLLCNLFKVFKTNKLYPYLKEKNNADLSTKERKSIFNNLYSLFFYKFGIVIQSNTDNILISIFCGTIMVGYYSNYSMIITSVTSFLSLVFTSLKASVGNFIVENSKEKQLKLFNTLEIYNFWLVCFCSICFMILIPDFIKICFGQEYVLSNCMLILIVLNFYTSNIRQIIWTFRETTGIFSNIKYITLVTSIINIFLSLILGYCIGLNGIILATIISRMIYAWWKEPKVMFNKYFCTNPKQYYINYIKRLLLMCTLSTIIFYGCSYIEMDSIYLTFIIKVLICIVFPNLILYLLYKDNDAIKIIQDKFIMNRVSKKY